MAGRWQAHLDPACLVRGSAAGRACARLAGEYPYANGLGQRLLEQHLDLVTADKGENVTIYRPADDGVWMETMPLPTRFREPGPFRPTWTC